MSMTVVVTRNASPRVRGFLASTMLELSSGVYSAPRLSPAVRERIWAALEGWWSAEHKASAVMVWQERDQPGGQTVRILGDPPVALVDVDGLILTRRMTAASAL